MDHYIDIQLKPDAEMRENVLLNKVFTKLHKRLFTLKSNSIGVSFPRYKVKLGKTVRVHGERAMLNDFQGGNWLGGLSGYCQMTEILAVPDNAQYRTISRKQSNMTEAKLRRLIKRNSITADQIKQYKAKMFTKGLDNPYLELDSASNRQKHRRFIEFGELLKQPTIGEFDQFGLSKQATVPWF